MSKPSAQARSAFDRDDPPVLGANAFVGLTRKQMGAALGRLLGRVAVEPGVVVTGAVEAARQLVDVARGRSDVAPAPTDKRVRGTGLVVRPRLPAPAGGVPRGSQRAAPAGRRRRPR
jgi:hypothetical protein